MISYHTQLTPFRFDKIVKHVQNSDVLYHTHSYMERASFDRTNELIERLQNSGWEIKAFEPHCSLHDYNAYASFHSHIRPTLFNEFDANAQLSHYFQNKRFSSKNNYTLEFYVGFKHFKLEIENVALRLHGTGVAILAVHMVNRSHQDPDAINYINQYLHNTYASNLIYNQESETYLDTRFPDKLSIKEEDKTLFESTNSYTSLPQTSKLYDYLVYILGETLFCNTLSDAGKYYVNTILGDSNFIMCYLVDNGTYRRFHHDTAFSESQDWQRLLLLNDQYKEVHTANTSFFDNETFAWIHNHAIFGLSNESFVLVSYNQSSNTATHKEKFDNHFFKTIMLMLIMKSSLRRLTDEVTLISSQIDLSVSATENVKILESIESLYKLYVKFINRLYYHDITSDKDSETIHRMLFNKYDISSRIDHISLEIQNLYDLYNFKTITERQKEDLYDKLTVLGGIFLPAGILSGVFGMNIFDVNDLTWQEVLITSIISYAVVILFLLKPIVRTYKRTFLTD